MESRLLTKEKSAATSSKASTSTANDPLHQLLDVQKLDGSFQASTKLFNVLLDTESHTDPKQRFPLPKELQSSNEEGWNLWTTALALAWLELKMSHRKGEWGLVASKSLKWLNAQLKKLANAPSGNDLVQMAVNTLQAKS
jgi:hypothetical protein